MEEDRQASQQNTDIPPVDEEEAMDQDEMPLFCSLDFLFCSFSMFLKFSIEVFFDSLLFPFHCEIFLIGHHVIGRLGFALLRV